MASVLSEALHQRSGVLGLNRRNQDYLFADGSRRFLPIVDNKRLTKKALHERGVPLPPTYRVYQVARQVQTLVRDLAPLGEFVVKPCRGAGGSGVLVVAGTRGDGTFMRPNGGLLKAADLAAHVVEILSGGHSLNQHQDEALVEYRVRPHPALGTLAVGGVPDLRLLFYRGVPVMAMLRLPTRASEGRANLHRGGMGVGIDLGTGRTTHAIWRRRSQPTHPDLGRPVVGLAVPGWDAILEVGARCHEVIPLGYLGVDIVIDIKRGPLVLELNARPGLDIQLANARGLRPLLESLAAEDLSGLDRWGRIALGRSLWARRRPPLDDGAEAFPLARRARMTGG